MLRHARRKALLAVSTAAAVAALSGSSLAAATPLPSQPAPATAAPAATAQGIIMRDGGVCDPIRHMGC